MQALFKRAQGDDGASSSQDGAATSRPSLKGPQGRLRSGVAGLVSPRVPERDTQCWEALDRLEQDDPAADF